ncbi:MAG TPA: protein translocase subunit SecD [Thermoanaerobaculia bacterium]|nr:protein translocase subunit SecD [Thermoanaerobaculia bacterium]
MSHQKVWTRVGLILVVLVASVAAYVASGVSRVKTDVTGETTPGLKDYLKNGIRLGLDLKGGIHLVLQVQTDDALKIETDEAVAHINEQNKEQTLKLGAVTRTGPASFSAVVNADTDIDKLQDAIKRFLPGWQYSRQGTTWAFSLGAPARKTMSEEAVQQAVETIRNRIDQFGVSEPVIAREGENRIVVQLPGVDDPRRVKDIIKSTAFLELKLVVAGPSSDQASLLAPSGGQVPPDAEIVEGNSTDQDPTSPKVYYLLQKVAAVTGRDIKNARPSQDQTNRPAVSFSLKAEGATKFDKVTGSNIGKQLAIVLDNRVQSAPRIDGRISDSGIITGSFTPERANDLALILRSGALPAGLVYLEERTVGPSLGLDSIRKGITAAVLGALLVFVAMVVYYRRSGFNAVLALILNAIILLGVLAQFGATLTLPGIAGFILTIGMAVDSNVLIFERIREELREGKTPKTAIDNGFSKAFVTIIDTHVTTVVSALFLFQFGTGPVKGFAVTLIVGLAASMFTAVYVSKTIFMLEYGSRERIESVSI